jgi:PQQ-like domain
MHPKGGIQAVDLKRGTSLWRSAEGERPLALSGNLLVAQAKPGQSGELRVVALDVRQQGALSSKAHLQMPAGIRADVSEDLDQAFQVTASPSRQGIVVAWEAQELPGLPGREEEERERRPGMASKAADRAKRDGAQGTVLFDPRAGRLSPVTAEAKAASPRAVVVSLPSAGPDRLFASADGRHVLASRRVEADSYLWKISDAATGAVLGSFRSDVSMSPFTVVGTRLFYVAQPGLRLEGSKMVEEPLRLRALDIATGRELWSRDIRDTAFRGPFPQ